MTERQVINVTFRFKSGTTAEWELKNPILRQGEPGLEEGFGNFKIGDGLTRWNDLPYFVDTASVSDNIALDALQQHLASLEPHPVYDDGPSLVLLYQNAKV